MGVEADNFFASLDHKKLLSNYDLISLQQGTEDYRQIRRRSFLLILISGGSPILR